VPLRIFTFPDKLLFAPERTSVPVPVLVKP